MTDRSTFFDLFNDKVDEFFKDLVSAFPHIQDFQRFKSSLIMLRNIDPKMPRNLFVDYFLIKYRDAILSKDEQVFLTETNFKIDRSQRKEYWLDFIDHMKTIWSSLDNETKEVIWKYLHVLTVLSDKCVKA